MSYFKRSPEYQDVADFNEFLGLFNGLDEIGGEQLRYKDIPTSMPSDAEKAFKMEIACIVLLSKPTKVLFAGLTSEKSKQLDELETDFAERMGALQAKKEKVEAKEAVEKTDMSAMKDAIDADIAKLEKEMKEHEIMTDGVDKHEEYLAACRAQTVDVQLAQFLPMLTMAEKSNLTPESRAAMDEARVYWADEFKDVNVSKAKRIALLSLQFRPTNASKQHERWIKIHGGRPLVAKPLAKDNNATKDIFNKDMEDFRNNRNDWDTREMKKVFTRRWKSS